LVSFLNNKNLICYQILPFTRFISISNTEVKKEIEKNLKLNLLARELEMDDQKANSENNTQ